MKTYLLLIALLLSSAVNAQTDHERVWSFLAFLNFDDPNEGTQFLKRTGISDTSAEALVQYVRRGLEDAIKANSEHTQALCKDKEKLRTREAFARSLESLIAEEKAVQKVLADNLGVVMSAEDEAKVRYWIDQEWHPAGGHSDWDLFLYNIRTGQTDHDAILATVCPPFEENSSSPQ